MEAKQASAKKPSLMLGCDNDEMQLILKAFYSRKDQGLEATSS